MEFSHGESKKPPTFAENLKSYFREYCENTSIHGWKFLGERGRYLVEKLWWLLCLVVSFYCCITLITKTYYKWQSSPVIVSFGTVQTPITNIPFPAVTICPVVKSRKHIYNHTKHTLWAMAKELLDEEKITNFEYMSLLCSPLFTIPDYNHAANFSDEEAIDFFLKVAVPIDDIIVNVQWSGRSIAANGGMEQILIPTLTSEGICYTFNLMDRDDLFAADTTVYKHFGSIARHLPTDNEYNDKLATGTFPRRAVMSGVKGGLELILFTRSRDVEPFCGEFLRGYKVMLQNPTEVPMANQHYFRVALDQHVVAAVKPNLMTTSDELKGYKIEDRQCYFNDEKKLEFFRIYNQRNCLIECLTNFTRLYCTCVAFYMPRFNSTPVCGSGMSWCLNEAESKFLTNKNNPADQNNDAHSLNEGCKCLPSCTSLEFDVEISQSDWDFKTTIALLNRSSKVEGNYFSRLQVFFKDMQFIASERHQLYGQTEFWANCGGLLGLFTGFSFISFAEILYFFSLRLICNIKKFGFRYWSGSKELIETKN